MPQNTSRRRERQNSYSPRYTVCVTKLLEQAFSEISQLPPEEQDRLATAILEELAAENAFDAKLAATTHLLDPLLRRVQEEDEAGLTQPLDPDAIELPYRR